MSEQQQERHEDSRDEQEGMRRVRPGPPMLAEPGLMLETGAPAVVPVQMEQTFVVVCSTCERQGRTTSFTSQHPVADEEQVRAMCPKCNEVGHKLTRTQVLTRANEFVVEYTMTFKGAVVIDNSGQALPVQAKDQWKIRRTPTVRRAYGISIGGHRLGFGPLIIENVLDAGDKKIRGMAKPSWQVDDEEAEAERALPLPLTLATPKPTTYDGTCILKERLLEHGKEVISVDLSDMPDDAYDGLNKSPHVVRFVYHRVKVGTKGKAKAY